jgi:hypothetical protein
MSVGQNGFPIFGSLGKKHNVLTNTGLRNEMTPSERKKSIIKVPYDQRTTS